MVVPQVARRRRSAEQDYLPGFSSKDLALNHIIDDWIDIDDIENEQILQTQYENLTIRMNIYPRPPNDDSYEYMYRYTANCAPIVKVNQVAENGIVHMIDRVLSPVTKNLMDLVRDRSDMAVLRTVLEKTNLAELLEKETKHFTLFAPNDKAFSKLTEQLRKTMKNGNECAMSKFLVNGYNIEFQTSKTFHIFRHHQKPHSRNEFLFRGCCGRCSYGG